MKTFVQTIVKDLTTDIKSLTSLKYLNEYEIVIQKAFDELFAIETLIKREIIKYYIDNCFCRKSWRFRETMSGQKEGITLTRSDVLKILNFTT